MLIVSFKPGHDGAIAAIRDGTLVLSLEAEKDSSERYSELHPGVLLELAERRRRTFFGAPVEYFTSSHERSHVLGAVGMAPRDDAPLQAVLVWEGALGTFYLVDGACRVRRAIPVYPFPKGSFRDSPLFDCGVRSELAVAAAAVGDDWYRRRG